MEWTIYEAKCQCLLFEFTIVSVLLVSTICTTWVVLYGVCAELMYST